MKKPYGLQAVHSQRDMPHLNQCKCQDSQSSQQFENQEQYIYQIDNQDLPGQDQESEVMLLLKKKVNSKIQ